MASRVEVVTDSTAYLPPELVEREGIHVLSLYYVYGSNGNTPIREQDAEGDFGPFYEHLAATGEMPTTLPPTIEDFEGVYRPLLADGASIVSIHISSALSTRCCANARAAARRLADSGEGGERIEVVDSASTAGVLGVQALAAARVSRAGGDFATVLERVKAMRQEAKVWFMVDTLEYLRRGGRIGTAAAWVGGRLQVKPIFTLESEVTAVERVRTRDRGIERVAELVRHWKAGGADAFFVVHTAASTDAQQLADQLWETFRRPPEFIQELGPVVGTHSGPGLIGCGACPSRFFEL
jgi:DegV family protein with EDD domain